MGIRAPTPVSRLPHLPGAALLCVAAVLPWSSPAAGQVVTGVLVEEEVGSPVEGAMISVVDSLRRARSATLTDGDGRFRITDVAPGRWVLRADRIGHASTWSDTLDLAAGDTVHVRMTAPVEAIALAGIDVEGEGRCAVRPDEGEATARVWDEARKALAAADWTRSRGVYRYRMVRYVRQLSPEALTIQREDRTYGDSWAREPFRSHSAEKLVREGFVETAEDGGGVFYAPDAGVLLSDPFLDTHCMRVRRDADEAPGMVGLAFEPLEGRSEAEIRGTLWLDARTSELRWLEYRYVNLDFGVATDRVGGRVDFERMPDGTWIVREWWIRMPRIGVRPRSFGGVGLERALAGFLQEGGRVVTVRAGDGEVVLSTEGGVVQGVVSDSTGSAPLEGATVWIAGVGDPRTTGEDGRFSFLDLGDGTYEVEWSHPYLDSLGLRPEPRRVAIRRGEVSNLEIRAPYRATVLLRRCAAESPNRPEGAGVLLGRIVSSDAQPLSRAEVSIEWSGWSIDSFPSSAVTYRIDERRMGLRVTADADGHFVTCLVPAGLPLDVHAGLGPVATDTVRVRIPADRGHAYREIRVPGEGTRVPVPDALRPRPDTTRSGRGPSGVDPGG